MRPDNVLDIYIYFKFLRANSFFVERVLKAFPNNCFLLWSLIFEKLHVNSVGRTLHRLQYLKSGAIIDTLFYISLVNITTESNHCSTHLATRRERFFTFTTCKTFLVIRVTHCRNHFSFNIIFTGSTFRSI